MKFNMINKKTLPFLGLGISTQAPINLIGGLLMLWATQSGLNLEAVGVFAAVTLPYCLTFLWAPFVDRINLPLANRFGRKKMWCLVWQLGVILGLLCMSTLTPNQDVMCLFFCALWVGFCGASQGMTVDGLRIDTLKGDDLTNGTVLFNFGNRLGYFAATAGMIALSGVLSWSLVYKIATLIILVGTLSVPFIREGKQASVPANFDTMVVRPFKDFYARQPLLLLCGFIVLYKLCNGMLGKMAYPFYYDVGFTKNQIALVSATFGSIITTIGVFCGGFVLQKVKFRPLLFWLGGIEILTSLAFAGLAAIGPSIPWFLAIIVFDNIVGGMGTAIWAVFLSTLCSRQFSATQYAFLNALTMVPLTLLGTTSGWLAAQMGWVAYFTFTGVLMVPALCMIRYSTRLFKGKKA
ncbi:MAG: MFS transporter [Alphaproteobacteria bacterium]|nr:MFS transporter [Alphaproteobacteria bacterium]